MTDVRWRVNPTHRVRLTPWEDGYTAFHGASGDTHLLDPFTGQVLSCLLDHAMDLDELARALVDRPVAELASEEREALERALAALARAHLAEAEKLS
ncbi:HPr-rel-A system PqqD family peptide chaperone [Thiobacter aerophilum]|uniref:HPr-rel-A system PqqD family peptide chaperone n=1 Tax=Thiobacter aerophilum TaxID=3121275 RepID=A0ABV0EGG2_9BURK